MCLRLSRGLSKVWHSRITSSAQRLGRKSRDNLSKTYTARNPYKRASPLLFLASSAALSSSVRFLPIIGARMKMPFSPRLTKRPSEFHVRSPARLVASGF